MFHKILIPLDGSKLAEQAVASAMQIANATARVTGKQSEVILMHVPVFLYAPEHEYILHEYTVIPPQHPMTETHDKIEVYLEVLQTTFQSEEVNIHIRILEGDVTGTIVDTAVTEEVDLIVMSTHGHTGVTRWVLGSVTEKVMRHAPCPVLAIRHPHPLTRVLITLDGSTLSETALTPGITLAQRLHCHVTLLQVREDLLIPLEEIEQLDWVEDGLGRKLEADLYTQEEDYLTQLAQKHQPNLGHTITTAVADGRAASKILDFAEANDIDLIVMATHGRSGMKRWVYGSVTEKVLRGAKCALLIVRPPL